MRAVERAGYLSRARTAPFARLETAALATIERFLSICPRAYLSYSAGKDSEVLLHLARRVAPGLVAVVSDDEFSLPETLARLGEVSNLTRIAGRIRHAEWFTAWQDGPVNLPEGTEWVDAEHNDGLGTWARQHGYGGALIGIRAQESPARRIALRRIGLVHQLQSGMWHCYPLGWWTTDDIWAYLARYDVPYNRAYDRMAEIGVPLRERRIGPFAPDIKQPSRVLAWLRAGWPREYARFAARFPEAKYS